MEDDLNEPIRFLTFKSLLKEANLNRAAFVLTFLSFSGITVFRPVAIFDVILMVFSNIHVAFITSIFILAVLYFYSAHRYENIDNEDVLADKNINNSVISGVEHCNNDIFPISNPYHCPIIKYINDANAESRKKYDINPFQIGGTMTPGSRQTSDSLH